jgi:hypothetical protein
MEKRYISTRGKQEPIDFYQAILQGIGQDGGLIVPDFKIPVLDLNELKEELNIDLQTETGDKGDHVNYKGAIKVTNYLGKWLKDKNILENHKDDQNYDKWNKDLEEFKKNVKY